MYINKTVLYSIMRIVVFLLILLLCIYAVSRVFQYKPGADRIQQFLACADQCDVLILGDSQATNGIFPMELWKKYGISSFNLSGANATLPLCYWILENALLYSSPQLVILGLPDESMQKKAPETIGNLHTALDGWPLNRTKWNAIADLTEEFESQNRVSFPVSMEFVVPFAKYHSRWSQLTKNDFFPKAKIGKGGTLRVGVLAEDEYELIDEQDCMPEEGPGFDYLRRIFELCSRKGIQVLTLHMPYPPKEERQRAANTVRKVSGEYGYHMLDLPRLKGLIDPVTDMCDCITHLNPSGAYKLTDYLGAYITAEYGILDHRNDSDYSAWQNEINAYIDEKLKEIRAAEKYKDALMLAHDEDFSVYIAVRSGAPLHKIMQFLQNIPRDHMMPGSEEYFYSCEENPLYELDGLEEDTAYFLIVDRDDGRIDELPGEYSDEYDTSFGLIRVHSDEYTEATLERNGKEYCWPVKSDEGDLFITFIDRRTGLPAANLSYCLAKKHR